MQDTMFMNKKLALFVMLTIFSAAALFPDGGISKSFIENYVSATWTTSDGLPANTVTDIIQDSQGYIFAGTYEGLVRFDGVKFININHNYDPKFNFVSARKLFEDSRGNMWVGSNDEGITVFTMDGRFRYYSTTDGLPNNSVRSICEAKDGTVWIGTASGIACISADGVLSIPESVELLPKGNSYLISSSYCDSLGRVWFFSDYENGAFYYENGDFYVYTALNPLLKGRSITDVLEDSEGTFWFGVDPRAVIRIKKGAEPEFFDISFGVSKGTSINDIFEDGEHNIWIAMDNGVAIYHDGAFLSFDKSNGLTDEKIVRIIEDRERNLWFATDRGGIQRLSHSKFTTFTFGRTVNSIVQDDFRGVMWIGSDDGLLCIKDSKFVQNAITEKCRNLRIRHVDVTSDGELLVSCYEVLGQIIVSRDGKITSLKKSDGIAGDKVRLALKIDNGDLYIGTTNGLSIVDAATGQITNITKDFGIRNSYIMALHQTQDGSVWVGTDGGGVFVLKNRELVQEFTTENGLVGNVIFKICEYDNQIWISTGSGLSVYTDGAFTSFNTANGMGTDSIFQTIYDGSERVWCTSNLGIFSVKMADIQSVIAKNSARVSSRFYGVSDGITSKGVTSTSRSFIDSSSKIWFTLIDGCCIYDAASQNTRLPAPLVHVEEIRVDSVQDAVYANRVVIPAGSKRVRINYTGISFTASDRIQFSTFLEGFDKDFTAWTLDRSVSYTNLKPGTYRFSVRAMSADEVMSEPSKVITIVKKPEFYQTFLFWALIAIALVLISYLSVRHRIERLKNARLRLEKLVQERTKELRELQQNLELKVEVKTAELRHERDRVQRLSIEITRALAGTIDAKDTYTKGHSSRVAEYSKMLALALGKSEMFVDNVYYAALLHDIGKIGIPDSIINKPGKLTPEEYDMIKQHPVIGSDILKSISSLPDFSVGARWHHERYDGTGYPDKLKGEDIPEIARIICVADSYDAMTSNRSYRRYLPQEAVREQIETCSGTQFDPVIAKKMLELIDADKDYKMHEAD